MMTSCPHLQIDRFTFFRDVLTRIADYPVTKLDELLSVNWNPAPA